MAINPNKPLRLKNQPALDLRYIGKMPEGTLVVYVEGWAIPGLFDPETGKGCSGWAGNTLENIPEVTSAFYGWTRQGQVGRGMISAGFVWSDCPSVKFCLEVIYTDDIPTGAKIHTRKAS